jgi:hypothetical protein
VSYLLGPSSIDRPILCNDRCSLADDTSTLLTGLERTDADADADVDDGTSTMTMLGALKDEIRC